MRLAFVCADPGVPVFGRKGCSIHVQEVLRSMLRRGIRVDLFAARLGGAILPHLQQVTLHRIPIPKQQQAAVRELACLEANRDLSAMLAATGPYDLVYERYSLWSFAAMQYSCAAHIPGLLEVNSPLIEEQARHRILIHRAEAENVARKVFKLATSVFTVAEELSGWVRRYAGVGSAVPAVSNGVDPLRFHPRPTSRSHFTVGFLGTLKPWHDLGNLVVAFSAFRRHDPEARLLIVGDGTERNRLLLDLEKHGLSEAVTMTGAVSPSCIPQKLAMMDVGMAPYPSETDFYFSPLKLFEYMAAGLPVVASRVGQVSRVLQDGVNGLLCPPGDPNAMCRALVRLHREPGLRRRLGRAARQTILREHSWDRVLSRILNLAGPEFGMTPQEPSSRRAG